MEPVTQEIQKLGELIKDIRIAMLTTVTSDGRLRSRPMATQGTPFDGDLWFFTEKRSMKVDEIGEQPQVNLSYMDAGSQRYVSVSGRAELVVDRAKAEELWRPVYQAWFPLGLDDPDLALLKVTVEAAEYWDSPSGTMTHLIGLVSALAKGQRYEPGEHEKVEL
jgi:general stress protein 26